MPRDEKKKGFVHISCHGNIIFTQEQSQREFILPHYMYTKMAAAPFLKHLQKGSPIQRRYIHIQVRVMMCHGENKKEK